MKIISLDQTHLAQLVPLFDAYRVFYRKTSDLLSAKIFLQDRMDHGEATIFGAYDEEMLMGFTLLYPLFSSTRMKPIYLLNDLYVQPAHRNKAVGKALLEYAQLYAIKTDRAGVLLETEKSNDVGNHLYPSVGFDAVLDSNFYFWENKKP